MYLMFVMGVVFVEPLLHLLRMAFAPSAGDSECLFSVRRMMSYVALNCIVLCVVLGVGCWACCVVI